MRHDFVQTLNLTLDGLDVASIQRHLHHYANEGMRLLGSSDIRLDRREIVVELDMSYAGQTHAVTVPLDLKLADLSAPTAITEAFIREAFERRYREIYRRLLQGIAVRLLSLRVAVIGVRPKFDLACLAPSAGETAERCQIADRAVWFEGRPHQTPVYDRLRLAVGAQLRGPAVLEQPDTTVLVDPGMIAHVDQMGNLILDREAASAQH